VLGPRRGAGYSRGSAPETSTLPGLPCSKASTAAESARVAGLARHTLVTTCKQQWGLRHLTSEGQASNSLCPGHGERLAVPSPFPIPFYMYMHVRITAAAVDPSPGVTCLLGRAHSTLPCFMFHLHFLANYQQPVSAVFTKTSPHHSRRYTARSRGIQAVGCLSLHHLQNHPLSRPPVLAASSQLVAWRVNERLPHSHVSSPPVWLGRSPIGGLPSRGTGCHHATARTRARWARTITSITRSPLHIFACAPSPPPAVEACTRAQLRPGSRHRIWGSRNREGQPRFPSV
jgi:hypothetical protein